MGVKKRKARGAEKISRRIENIGMAAAGVSAAWRRCNKMAINIAHRPQWRKSSGGGTSKKNGEI